jgi:hypothetical protein
LVLVQRIEVGLPVFRGVQSRDRPSGAAFSDFFDLSMMVMAYAKLALIPELIINTVPELLEWLAETTAAYAKLSRAWCWNWDVDQSMIHDLVAAFQTRHARIPVHSEVFMI